MREAQSWRILEPAQSLPGCTAQRAVPFLEGAHPATMYHWRMMVVSCYRCCRQVSWWNPCNPSKSLWCVAVIQLRIPHAACQFEAVGQLFEEILLLRILGD